MKKKAKQGGEKELDWRMFKLFASKQGKRQAMKHDKKVSARQEGKKESRKEELEQKYEEAFLLQGSGVPGQEESTPCDIERSSSGAGQVYEEIPSSNVGYQLLQKLGWQGGGLGREGKGITAPIPASMKKGRRCIGYEEDSDHS
uniref:G-patch domain-containing protein n=1 Tax=Palpitomonas bilix TaxID=652834 RepID=A0A7S3LY53_9EUKA|mmetsp:Transcript_9555/g.25860  ORF Transcript_9555/g.25860 Transcript_9555/m.25860 type:complete len:144 (+) Transcript_9555:305-736(+)